MKLISLIICSRNNTISPELENNISSTIGCGHELIVIDNTENTYSIFEAYNLGIRKSKGDIMCFIHDDILFHSENWGGKLLELFEENQNYGLIGVAGSKVKTRIPSGWWGCKGENMLVNIIQDFPDGTQERQEYGFQASSFNEAVVIDGVFMALKREVGFNFDSNLEGFHGYDLILSFEVKKKGFKIGITNEILLQHFSIGNLNSSWLEAVNKIHHRYRRQLPMKTATGEITGEETRNCERIVKLSNKLKNQRLFYRYWFQLLLLKPSLRLHYKIFTIWRYETK